MVKIFVIYDTKYGNTKLVAEKIGEGMMQAEDIDVTISDVKEIALKKVADSDVILIGSPNHIGKPTRTIKKFIDKLGKLHLKAKWVTVFDTNLGGNQIDKAVKKMVKKIGEKVPDLKLITSGLSIIVGGMKGPLVEGELSKCITFGNKIVNQLKEVNI